MQQFVDGLKWLLGGPIVGAVAVLVGTWAAHHWGSRERSAERREVRKAATLAQRDTDLRELGGQLTELVTTAQEIIWERQRLPAKGMPRSDPRSMRLTGLAQKLKLFRIVIGDADLSNLVAKVSSAAITLSDSPVEMDTGLAPRVHEDTHAAQQALNSALSRIATLLRETEIETAALGGSDRGMLRWQRTRGPRYPARRWDGLLSSDLGTKPLLSSSRARDTEPVD